jgi:ABC-2 type transport system permease protein
LIRALFYLQFYTIWNRTWARIKRLRQPKYLLFAIVGGLYFYFYFFRHVIGRSFRTVAGPIDLTASADTLALYELGGAFILFLILFLAWIVPRQRAALIFTEAEIAFLFPAPISRRGLIHYKLLRSQLSIFITTIFLALLSRRFAGHFWFKVGGWWLILSILNLHFIGSSFARTLLMDKGVSNWQRRSAVALIVLIALGLVIWWARRTAPELNPAQFENLEDFKRYIEGVLLSGPALYLLYPFRLIVRPYLAPDLISFLIAAAPAMGLLLLHYWWVVRSDVAFEEASLAASQKLAAKVAAVRSGNLRGVQKPVKAKKAPFRLRPLGLQPIALLWKNLISAGQAFSPRVWIVISIFAIISSFVVRSSSGSSALLPALSMISAMFVVWTLLLGPQFVRQDLRHDLPRADILKMYPMRGWQIVLGELLAPMAILTGIQWFLLIVSVSLSGSWPGMAPPLTLRLGIGFSAALLAPLLNLITLQIPNGAVLLLPAWFQSTAQGIEATGQRIVFMLASLLVFILALAPAAGVYALALLLVKSFSNLAIAFPVAAVSAGVVLGIEGGLGIMLLGWLFERYDVSAESTP